MKLYIPGKIIHLVDVSSTEDESKYIPYWASRYDFNQVVLSGTLLSDHSMIPLPDIIKNIDLDDVHETDAFRVQTNAQDEDEPRFLKFIICSYPNGGFTSLLVVSSLVGVICSFLSNMVCKYVTRETVVMFDLNSTNTEGVGVSAGLYSYTLKQCPRHDETCKDTSVAELEDSQYCQPYPDVISIDNNWLAARICSMLSFALGLIGLAVVSVATCTKMKKKRWRHFSVIFIMASILQGLQLLLLNSSLCTTLSVPGQYVAFAACSLSDGAYMSITALLLHFFTAVGCTYMFRRK